MAPSLVDTVRANYDAGTSIRAELRSIDEAATAERRDYTDDEKKTISEKRSELAVIDERISFMLKSMKGATDLGELRGVLADIEVGADLEGSGDGSVRRIGGITPVRFTEEQYRSLHESFLRSTPDSMEARSVTAYPAFSAQSSIVVNTRREPTRVTSLMPTQPIANPSVTYYKQSASASAAATVAVGAAKPESTPGWTAVVVNAAKIAHYTDVPTEALADYANFQAVVDAEMTAGVIQTENTEVLSGDGTGTHMTGLLSTSGILTYAPGSAEARYLSILHATTLLRTGTSFVEPDAILLHPTDWEIIRRTPSTTAELVVQTDPTASAPVTLWGVPVIVTTGLTAGTAIVASLSQGTVVFEREPVRVMIDPYSQSKNNLVRFIAEERLALGVTRPTSILAVTFNGTA